MPQEYLSKGWLIGVLIAILLSSGGWVVGLFEKNDDQFRGRIEAVERSIVRNEGVDAKREAQLDEIIRRLDRIERTLDGSSRRRNEAPYAQ